MAAARFVRIYDNPVGWHASSFGEKVKKLIVGKIGQESYHWEMRKCIDKVKCSVIQYNSANG
ncbi:MAG: hypothetical protein K2P23_12960 [Lachnospiraceae bacterium]|nr:hypothetical protein [Lachnospiraceae bacterium]